VSSTIIGKIGVNAKRPIPFAIAKASSPAIAITGADNEGLRSSGSCFGCRSMQEV
jgi:hypothetical protein